MSVIYFQFMSLYNFVKDTKDNCKT